MNYPDSKLPNVGTTIFTVMSQMANQYNAINLAQGFPDFNGPPELLNAVNTHVSNGLNQYAPMAGIIELRTEIAKKIANVYQKELCPETEITITSGATEAIYAAITAVIRAGDEVIVFDPAFDCYDPAIELNGGKVIHVQLAPPRFEFDWEAVGKKITDRTKLIILNSPHNPTGSVFKEADIAALTKLVTGTDILLIADDVYEHIIFDDKTHLSFVKYEELFKRSFIVSSFGKTYHVTGWKIGYCVAPQYLTNELRKVHQYLNFCTSSPLQYALVNVMREKPEHCLELPAFYQHKRDLFNRLMETSRFSGVPTSGSYFQVMDYSHISDLDDMEFCEYLTKEVGVAAIPLSVFCETPPAMKLVRFCFAKSDDTLRAACEKLCTL